MNKEDLIKVLNDNEFKETTNGKQTRYIKQFIPNSNIDIQLMVVANKRPLLFYEIKYKGNVIHRKNLTISIDKAVNMVESYCNLEDLY